MRVKSAIFITAILLVTSFTPVASADRGIIPPSDVVAQGDSIREPRQEAIIVWNGNREMLYLTTDLEVTPKEYSRKVNLIEVLPLPSLPEVKRADEKTFENMNRLLQEKKARMSWYGVEEKGGGALSPAYNGYKENMYPGVYIELNEFVGLHNITVLRVENVNGFVRWIKDYYEHITGENFTIPDWMEGRVEYYLDNEINYFVFDYVSVYPSKVYSVEPVVYTFDTESLYYPMYLTSGLNGYGEVRLFIVTDRILREKDAEEEGFSVDDVIPLRKSELKAVNSTIYNFPWKGYLQLYVMTSYVQYSPEKENFDLVLQSEGIYTPPIYGLRDVLVFLLIFALFVAVLYILQRRVFSNK